MAVVSAEAFFLDSVVLVLCAEEEADVFAGVGKELHIKSSGFSLWQSDFINVELVHARLNRYNLLFPNTKWISDFMLRITIIQ